MEYITHISSFVHHLTYIKRYSKHTTTAYNDDLEQWQLYMLTTYGSIPITQLQSIHIRSWLASLKQAHITAKSINRKLSALKSFFKYLIQENVLTHSPIVYVQAPKITKRLPQYVATADIATLLHYVPFTNDYTGALHKAIISLLYHTGTRLSEVLHLTIQHVSIVERTIKVLGKGNKERIIPLTTQAIQDLTQYLHWRSTLSVIIDATTLLLNHKGKKLYEKYIYNTVHHYLSMVTTISKKSPHVLRHSFATHLTNNGAELNAVKELLGHSSLAATQVYTHNSIAKLKAIHEQAHPKQ